jgi:pilus assembly protein CpaE
MSTISQIPDSIAASALSIALIGPNERSRLTVAMEVSGCAGGEVHEFLVYPSVPHDVAKILAQNYDVVMVDLDSDPDHALDVVESLCADGSTTVMVYSTEGESGMVVPAMRAGAREFLTLPLAPGAVAEALVRASVRYPARIQTRRAAGKVLVFLGSKGGSGTTTLACNFAVALAQECGQRTLLIDLDLPLGDAGINLGLSSHFSTINALQNCGRLDANFLSALLTRHGSGLQVLTAPGEFVPVHTSTEAIDRLARVARQDFDCVVIDAGSRLDLTDTALFRSATMIYLVTQIGVPELRNSHRLISQYFTEGGPKVEVVVNRFMPRAMGIGEDEIEKALTRPVRWKIPNDYATVREMQNTATPLVAKDSAISRVIRQMARTACGMAPAPEKKKGFRLFG